MVSEKMAASLNKQLNAELYSSYLYLAMAAYASHKGLPGTSNWCYIQAKEEMLHVQKMYEYVDDQGAQVILDTIEKPPSDFGTIADIFNAVLAHEQKVTGLINALMNEAVTEGDHATETFLQWYVTEQTEEEKSVQTIIDQLRLAGGDTGAAVYMIDKELATRVLTVTAI